MEEGGPLGHYNAADFKRAMAPRGGGVPDSDYSYECLGCFHWFNVGATATPGVRITEAQTSSAVVQDFRPDAPVPLRLHRPIVVQVNARNWDPMQHKGAWLVASSIERVFAMIRAASRDGSDPDRSLSYRKLMKNLKVTFELIADENLSLRSLSFESALPRMPMWRRSLPFSGSRWW